MIRDMTPSERKEHAQLVAKLSIRARALCALAPIPIFWPIWHQLRATAGIEGAAVLAITVQLALVILLANPIARTLANWHIRRRRRQKH